MIRLLIPVFVGATIFLAGYYLYKGFRALGKAEFIYVRFRNGVLVLKRKTRFSEREVQFRPHELAQNSDPKLLAASAGRVEWFTYPKGHPVAAHSEEAQAIERCLRYASNTGLLQAELATE